MNNRELLNRVEACHQWQSEVILKLQDLIDYEDKLTQKAILDMRNDILQKIQLNISEMEILAMELEVE